MRPTAHAFGLARRTQDLTLAHRELIKLLAEQAVSDFLAETDAANTADEHDRKE